MSQHPEKPFRIIIGPGDGIGPEITAQMEKLLPLIKKAGRNIEWEEILIGAAGIRAMGSNLPDSSWETVKTGDALITSCVGDAEFDHLETIETPSAAMLKLRKRLDLYANIRPVKSYPQLYKSAPIKDSILNKGVDIVIARELVGGLYFGPKDRETLPDGSEKAYDTMLYTTGEIERIARTAFMLAKSRKKHVTSVDKANVLKSSQLWRDTVNRISIEYPDIEVDHRYVDAFSMQLIKFPYDFDVVVIENTFGDIVSDLASVMGGSLGMLPSASMGNETWVVDGVERRCPWLYEPIHGTAPDIAGQNIANPISMVLSLAMLCRSSMKDEEVADGIEKAVEKAIADGYRTADIYSGGSDIMVNTDEMGDKIYENLKGILGV